MFFAEDRIEHMQAMILARDEKSRRKALLKLLPTRLPSEMAWVDGRKWLSAPARNEERQGVEVVPGVFFCGWALSSTKEAGTPLPRNWRFGRKPGDQKKTPGPWFTGYRGASRMRFSSAFQGTIAARQDAVQPPDSKSLANGEMWLIRTLR
jgi:hypothetical protein